MTRTLKKGISRYPDPVKLVFVGNYHAGKSTLIESFYNGKFTRGSANQEYRTDRLVGKKEVSLILTDTDGDEATRQ